MNNLTPLQALTAQIYCANIAASQFTNLEGNCNRSGADYVAKELLQQSIDEAKALLEATKPEPLEWKETEVKGYTNPAHYSNGYEFEIAQTNGGKFQVCSTQNLELALGTFPTLDEAKQFAEHIRTR